MSRELITEQDTRPEFSKDRAYKKLMSEKGGSASNLEIVEARTEDLRERQYFAEIESGSTPAEAALESGWTPPTE